MCGIPVTIIYSQGSSPLLNTPVHLTISRAMLWGWDIYSSIFQIRKLRLEQVKSVVLKPGCASEPPEGLLIIQKLGRESVITDSYESNHPRLPSGLSCQPALPASQGQLGILWWGWGMRWVPEVREVGRGESSSGGSCLVCQAGTGRKFPPSLPAHPKTFWDPAGPHPTSLRPLSPSPC